MDEINIFIDWTIKWEFWVSISTLALEGRYGPR